MGRKERMAVSEAALLKQVRLGATGYVIVCYTSCNSNLEHGDGGQGAHGGFGGSSAEAGTPLVPLCVSCAVSNCSQSGLLGTEALGEVSSHCDSS